MRRAKEQKGITLIALIITIIVLLILAVVAIGAVTNNGIIDHAKNAREEYGKAGVNENTTLQGYLDKIKDNIPTGVGTSTGTGTGEKENVDTFTFFITTQKKVEYKAEKGMTWEQWLNSTYKTYHELRGTTLEGLNFKVIKDREMIHWYLTCDGKYVDAASEIVEGKEYKMGYVYNQGNGTKINFTINGTSYEAEEAMHWGAWLESDYNTSGAEWTINGDVGNIYMNFERGDSGLIKNKADNSYAVFNHAIVANGEYIL